MHNFSKGSNFDESFTKFDHNFNHTNAKNGRKLLLSKKINESTCC